jgi:GGDEF domain-containing protein
MMADPALKLPAIEDAGAGFLRPQRRLERQGLAARCRQVASLAELAGTLDEGGRDAVLRAAAGRPAACAGAGDTVARPGGDEFVVVQPDVAEDHTVSGLARKLPDAIAEPLEIAGHEISVTGSIGIGMFPKDGTDHEVVLRDTLREAFERWRLTRRSAP